MTPKITNPITLLQADELADILVYIIDPEEKMKLRLVSYQFDDAIHCSTAWANITDLKVVWNGEGGLINLNGMWYSRTLYNEAFLAALQWILPKISRIQTLDVRSTVIQKSENFNAYSHEVILPSDEFWGVLTDALCSCPFSRLKHVEIDVGRLGIPFDLQVVTRAVERLKSSLSSLVINICWVQFGGIDRFRQLLSGIGHAQKLKKFDLLISNTWNREEHLDCDEIYAEIQNVLHDKINLIEFKLKTEFLPSTAALLQLLNSFTPNKLEILAVNLPTGDGNALDPSVFKQVRDFEFNLRIVPNLNGDWLLRVPTVCPSLKMLRTDYVNPAPLDADDLRQVITEWFWTIGENKPSVHYWPVLRETNLTWAVHPLKQIMQVIVREEIGSNLCWIVATGEDKKLNICVKKF